MADIQVVVPDMGDFHDVAVIEILVAVGDTVAAEQSLITVESDKASLEIPSSHAGVVKSLAVKLGDKVSQGSVLLTLESETAQTKPSPQPSPSGRGSKPMANDHNQRLLCRRESPGISPLPAGRGQGEG